MNDSKKRHFAEQVKRFRARFVQKMGLVLGEVLPAPLLMQWVAEEVGHFRQRLYDPLQTLMLFIEQVLGADRRSSHRRSDLRHTAIDPAHAQTLYN